MAQLWSRPGLRSVKHSLRPRLEVVGDVGSRARGVRLADNGAREARRLPREEGTRHIGVPVSIEAQVADDADVARGAAVEDFV